MNPWWKSRRLLVYLFAAIATTQWQSGYLPIPNVEAIVWISVVFIGGQSLVDAARAFRGGGA